MSFLYAIVFGWAPKANYLPTYITTIYGFSTVDAGARTVRVALAAVRSGRWAGGFPTGSHRRRVLACRDRVAGVRRGGAAAAAGGSAYTFITLAAPPGV